MRAAVYHGRRDVRVEEVAERSLPASGEILLDVGLASICGTDVGEWLHGPGMIPLTKPHFGSGHCGPIVIGHEFFGTVAAVGSAVDGFAVGQRVVSGAGVSCGTCRWCRSGLTNLCATYYTLGLNVDGGLAEQVLAPASTCLHVPDACSDRSAVLAQPLSIAFHSLARSRAQPGDRVVVVGAGAIGAFIIAAASSRGFRDVIAVDVADGRLEAARAMGAHATLFADAPLDRLQADVVIEATGVEAGLTSALAAVRRGGRLLVVGMHDEPRALDLRQLNLDEIELVTTNAHVCSADLPAALSMLSSNELADLAIDRVIPLEAVVDEGLAAMADGRVGGKVVVDVARN